MAFWLRCSDWIDRIMERIAQGVCWLTLAMILIGAFNAVARYGSRFIDVNLSSNALIEIQWYLFSLVFLLGAAYTFKRDGHVRVDVFYGRLSPRPKAWLNLVGNIVFLIPFCCFMIFVSWGWLMNSWAVWEDSPDPGGLPRYPIKTLVPLAFVLLFFQASSNSIKQCAFLAGQAPNPAENAGTLAERDQIEGGHL